MNSPSSPLTRRAAKIWFFKLSPSARELGSKRTSSETFKVSMRPPRTCVIGISSGAEVESEHEGDLVGATKVVGSGLP